MPDPQGAPFPMGFFDTFNCHSAVLARENLPIPDRKVKKKKKKSTKHHRKCQHKLKDSVSD